MMTHAKMRLNFGLARQLSVNGGCLDQGRPSAPGWKPR
jgi:hypothetical protein